MEHIFVFGSNQAGRHGKGAALHARMNLGAEYGVGEGLTGKCYALPTKDYKIKTRSLASIEESIVTFLKVAGKNRDKLFLTTPIGCGLAGYSKKEIASLFAKHSIPDNVVFTNSWFNQYNEVSQYG
jgi:hypothetical protein